MRIGIFVAMAGRQAGGTETYEISLIKQMASLNADQQFHVFCLSRQAAAFEYAKSRARHARTRASQKSRQGRTANRFHCRRAGLQPAQGRKADHRHVGDLEAPYDFTSVEQLIRDFKTDIDRLRGDYDE